MPHPTPRARAPHAATFTALFTLLLLFAAPPAEGQRFYGTLTEDDKQLADREPFDVYTLHCVGGEALQIELVSAGFEGRVLLRTPDDNLIASPDPRVMPAWGTRLDVIAEHPGDYQVLVIGGASDASGDYYLTVSPLDGGQWVTVDQSFGITEGGVFTFGFLAREPQPERLLVFCEDHAPTVSVQAGQAGGTHGPGRPFAQDRGMEFPMQFESVGMPLATVALANGADGAVYWAHQRYYDNFEVEHKRSITPQARADGAFSEGSRETSFNVILAEGQYFFAFALPTGDLDHAGADGPSHEDYRVSVTGPDGRPVEGEGASAYAAEFNAPSAGAYTVRVVGGAGVPDTFELAYAMGRDVPDLYAPIRWSSTDGQMTVGVVLDDASARVDGRRQSSYSLRLSAGDRVTVTAASTEFQPTVAIVAPDETAYRNEGVEGSPGEARVDFTATQDGLFRVTVAGLAAVDAGACGVTVRVETAGAGGRGAAAVRWTAHARLVGELDAECLVAEGRAFRYATAEVPVGLPVRVRVTGDGLRVDVTAGQPEGDGLIQPEYDAETNTSTVTIPAGHGGRIEYVVLAGEAGGLGGYAVEIQVPE